MKTRILIIAAALLILIAFFGLLVTSGQSRARHELAQPEFVSKVQSNLLGKIRMTYPPQPGRVAGRSVMLHEVRGTFYETDAAGQPLIVAVRPVEVAFHARVQITEELERKLFENTNFTTVTLMWPFDKMARMLSGSR